MIMRGTSCSGKSTDLINQDIPQSCILSSDNLREIVLGDRSKQTGNDKIFKLMYDILESRLSNGCNLTAIDATNLKISDIKEPIRLAEQYGAKIVIHNIEPPSLEVLLKRNHNRFCKTGFLIPDHVFEKHIHRFHSCLPAFKEYEKEVGFDKFEVRTIPQTELTCHL